MQCECTSCLPYMHSIGYVNISNSFNTTSVSVKSVNSLLYIIHIYIYTYIYIYDVVKPGS